MLVALNRPATWRVEVRDFDGELATPTGSVTVSLTDAADAPVASGAATAGATGIYTYALPSDVTGTLGVYTATASYVLAGVSASVTETVETVGNYLFDVADLRAHQVELAASATYSAERIRDERDTATQRMETAGQVAFATRRRRVTLDGSGITRLLLPDVEVTRLVSCTLHVGDVDTVLTADELADVDIDRLAGMLIRAEGWPSERASVTVVYEHGYTVTPGPVRKAAMILAAEALLPTLLPARATSQSTSLGDFRVSTANPDAGRETGIPEVDAVIGTYGRRRPRIR